MRKALLVVLLLCAGCVAGLAQTPAVLDAGGKLRFHVERTVGVGPIAMSGVTAASRQMTDSPTEWGQGGDGYSKRLASSVASSGIRSMLAFGLDSTLHQDPRYYRSGSNGLGRRIGHALRGTILTGTDTGGETLSAWRLGSAYGAAYISNQWYPDRLNTVRSGFVDGSTRLGFDFAKNVIAEFWPDIKNKISHRKP